MNPTTEPPTDNPYASPAPIVGLSLKQPEFPVPIDAEVRELFQRGKNGAAWFYWIAILSLINTVVAWSEGGIMFALGLDITMLTDSVAADIARQPDGNRAIVAAALIFDAIALGLLVLCGRLSQRRMLAVYGLGIGFYLLDGLLALLLGGIVSIAIHAYALWSMGKGFLAFRQLNALETQMRNASHTIAPGA